MTTDNEDKKGYYAQLNLTFRATEDDINKRYKKLALKYHPDRNRGDEANASQTFQKITTAYHVLADEEKSKAYLELFRLRCYMSQTPPTAPDAPLRPHYIFSVQKSKSSRSGARRSLRLLVVDMLARKIISYRKDTELKQFDFADVASLEERSAEALEVTLNFNNNTPYFVRLQTPTQLATFVAVFSRIAAAGADATDEQLNLVLDDEEPPAASQMKSKCLKRSGSTFADLLPRFLVLGETQLILFRDGTLKSICNVFPVDAIKHQNNSIPAKGASPEAGIFTLATSTWRAVFRVASVAVASEWCKMLDILKGVASGLRSSSSLPVRPSVVYAEEDICTTAAPPSHARTTVAAIPEDEEVSLAAAPAPAAVAAAVAPTFDRMNIEDAEAELSGGWLQFSDDFGRPYYFHPETGRSTWEAPSDSGAAPHLSAAAASVVVPPPPADYESGHTSDDEEENAAPTPAVWPSAEEDKKVAAHFRETESTNVAVAAADARRALAAAMAAYERKFNKARRCLDGGRRAADFVSLFEHVRIANEEMNAAIATFEAADAANEARQDHFIRSNRDYLDGVQSRMIGDVAGVDGGMASRIFKRCAYVADAMVRNKTTVL